MMNAVDFICLIPFFISLLLEGLEDVEIVGKAGKMIRFLKILREEFKVKKNGNFLFSSFRPPTLNVLKTTFKASGIILRKKSKIQK